MRKINNLIIFWLCIVGFSLLKCKNQTIKPLKDKNIHEISYDSLKTFYRNGDKIIINGWVLNGPKNFLDSVSIDPKLVKIKLLNKDSAFSKFGNSGSKKFYEVSVPEMDSLPKGEFIDHKIYKYLDQSAGGVFLVNGDFIDSYSRFLNRIMNRKIEYISAISPTAAIAIWGDSYGRHGALEVKVSDNSKAQKTFLPFSSNSIGRKLVPIDSLEYYSNKITYEEIKQTTTIVKNKKVIKVPYGDSSIEFKDDTTDENFMEYSVLGENKENHWILIQGQDYNQDYYYVINQRLKTIDTLVGEPRIFYNKLLCQEGSYTDSPEYLEIWDINHGKLQLFKKFSLRKYDVYTINDSFLKNGILYVKYHDNKYLKLKI